MFPYSPDEYKALEEQGKNVQYTETDSETIPPEGEGWSFWSLRQTPDDTKAVWRRIVDATTPMG